MRIGFGLPVAGGWATPETIGHVAEQAERLGYHSLWSFQRLLVGTDQQLAPVYQSVLDPMVSLAYTAARTTRIRLGVAVVDFPFVPPVLLAKQAATLDVLSGGRHELGLGAGWSEVEFAATGTSTRRRGARAAEYVAVLRSLWADEVSEFDGEFYRIPPSRMAPRPVQRPGPPILLGGSAKNALRRAGRLADGWVSGSTTDLSQITESIGEVRAAARHAGRDPKTVRIVSRGVVRVGEPTAGPDRKPLSGSYEQIRADTRRLAEMGVTELFYDLNWDPLLGAPDADPVAAARRVEEVMQKLAPDGG